MADRLASTHLFRADLKRVMSQSRLYPFMEHHSLDVAQMLYGGDDFFGDTLRTDIYTVSNGGGAGAASPVITGGALNGICDFVTGTGAGVTARSALSTGLSFRGDHGAVMVACLALDIITSVKVEVGFTDDATDTGAVLVKATPTFTATDCALWCLDTNDNANWEGLSANNGTTSPMVVVEAGISPVANTYEWLMVELVPNDTVDNECSVVFRRFTQAGKLTYEATGGTGTIQGVNSNVLLTPWVYVEARNGTSKTLGLDYWNAWQMRAAL